MVMETQCRSRMTTKRKAARRKVQSSCFTFFQNVSVAWEMPQRERERAKESHTHTHTLKQKDRDGAIESAAASHTHTHAQTRFCLLFLNMCISFDEDERTHTHTHTGSGESGESREEHVNWIRAKDSARRICSIRRIRRICSIYVIGEHLTSKIGL